MADKGIARTKSVFKWREWGEEVSDDMRPVCLQKLCFRALLTSQDTLYKLDHKERKNKTNSATLQTLSQLPEANIDMC